MALEFTDSNFETEVINSDKLSVVDFWAEWCGPCRMITPIIEQLSEDYDGEVNVGKLNVDDNSNVSQTFKVRSIPTILLFKNGEVVDKHVGTISKVKLQEKIDKFK